MDNLEKRAAVIRLYKQGKSKVEIKRALNFRKLFIHRTIKRFNETLTIADRPRRGRPVTKYTPEIQNAVRQKVRRNPRHSIIKLAEEHETSYGTMQKSLQNI